jgi:phosphatidylinositol glycan class N
MKTFLRFCFYFFYFTLFFLVEKSPVLYYTYHLLPLVLWWYSFRQSSSLLKAIHLRWRYFAWTLLLILGIELLVAAFFYRWFLSVALCFLALWPHLSKDQSSKSNNHETFKTVWMFSCLLLAIFPVLPPVGKHSMPLLV